MSTTMQPVSAPAAPITTIWGALLSQAADRPNTPALLDLESSPLTYDGLWRELLSITEALRCANLARGDIVAVGLPEGRRMITASLAATARATAMPVNPDDPKAEAARRLRQADARLVLVEAGMESPLREAAEQMGIPVLEIACEAAFGPEGADAPAASMADLSDLDDRAFLLPTSGTTGDAKLVAKSHRQFIARARDRVDWLDLGETDRLLAIASLYYAHAWTAVMATLLSGGSVICGLPFTTDRFFEAMARYEPTWYTAVPAVHRAILAVAANHADVLSSHKLRLIRSGSAALPSELQAELERVFGVPVIQGYSLTEADITSNPLPPRARKPGSAGIPYAHEVAVFGEDGQLLAPGDIGEIGYRLHADRLAPGEVATWTLTGDTGYFDADGYLFLTGRKKELISRGGSKIAPLEVERALLQHAAVAEAVAFAIPHRTLGEDVGAAVALRPGSKISEQQLLDFTRGQLAAFKVPRRIAVLDELPIGPAGKVQRRALAEQLGFTNQHPDERETPPSFDDLTNTQAALSALWREVLDLPTVGLDDEFFELGGDSLAAVRLLAAIQQQTGIDLPPASMFEGATVRHMAELLDGQGKDAHSGALVPIQVNGTRTPFFCVHPISGDVLCFAHLARRLGNDQPFYALQRSEGAMPCSIELQAASYVDAIRTLQPRGPYLLGGYSAGATVALEMAQQLTAHGEEVGLLAVIDHPAPGGNRTPRQWWNAGSTFVARDLPSWLRDFAHRDAGERATALPYSAAKVINALRAAAHGGPGLSALEAIADLGPLPDGYRERYLSRVRDQHRALREYRPRPYPGRVTLFRACVQPLVSSHDPALGWRALASAGVEVHDIPGKHLDILREPHVSHLARSLQTHFERHAGQLAEQQAASRS